MLFVTANKLAVQSVPFRQNVWCTSNRRTIKSTFRHPGVQQAWYHLTNRSEQKKRGIHHTRKIMTANSTDAAAHLNNTTGGHNAHHPTCSDDTAQTTGSEAPLNEQTIKSEPSEPTMEPKSRGVAQEKWIIAQAKQRRDKNSVGDNVRLQSTSPSAYARPKQLLNVYKAASADLLPEEPSNPMSDVLNIPELLEQILLNLKTSFLIKKAMLVCRGFKQSLDGSPAFKKRSSFAFRINFDPGHAIPAFYVNIRPKWMPRLYNTPRKDTVEFSFQGSVPWFNVLAATEGLRRLRVFEKMPPMIWIGWKAKGGRQNVGRALLLEDGLEMTFGHVFDALATDIPLRGAVDSVEITWRGHLPRME
jgi:hypothetical protein